MTRRIKFIWGASRVIQGRWYLGLFGLYSRRDGWREDGLAISVRGLLLWLVAASGAGYLAGATALFWMWQRDPYSLRTYSDAVLFPLRRGALRDKNGQALIARGTDAMRGQKWADGVAYLRQGLALHPQDWRARLTLAQFYAATNQRAVAMRVLQEGLTDAFPGKAHLTGMFAIAEQGEDFEVIVKTARRYLPLLQGAPAQTDRRWLFAREISALMGARRLEEALARLAAAAPGDASLEQRVLVLLDLHRPADALRALAEGRAQPGADRVAVVRLSVRAFREAGRFDEMERALAELRALTPADPRPAVYGVVQQALAGRAAPARAALDDYLFRFGGAAENLQLLAEPLAEIADLALLDSCAAAAHERGYAARPFAVLLVQARAKRGEWASAAGLLSTLPPAAGRTATQDQLWREWMRRLLDAVQPKGNTTSLALVDFLRSRPWPVKMFQATVEALRRAQQWETARDVLGLARGMFPASTWVEQQAAAVAQEIAARLPAPPDPVAAKSGLPAASLFFQRLDGALSGGQWAAADQLLREARNAQPAPDWLGARDGDLRLAEIRVAQAFGERARMLAAAALYLNGDTGRTRQALDLARAFHAKGDGDSAQGLAEQVLRRSPDEAAARKLIAAWRPKPAPAQ